MAGQLLGEGRQLRKESGEEITLIKISSLSLEPSCHRRSYTPNKRATCVDSVYEDVDFISIDDKLKMGDTSDRSKTNDMGPFCDGNPSHRPPTITSSRYHRRWSRAGLLGPRGK
jgi:hypothetical protein